MLVPAIARMAARAGKIPRAVTADRGYGEQAVEDTLEALGVRTVVLPRKGKPTAARRAFERRRSFQRLVKWRTGSEGRINCLKRDYGWARTRTDSIHGARTSCGHGVLAHNLVKIARLIPCSAPTTGQTIQAHQATTTDSLFSGRSSYATHPESESFRSMA